jgi:tRNA threonylcarbamoyladenosine biosynthesis protein TsaE
MLLESAKESEAFGRTLGERTRAGDVIALFGDLGAGKTTLSRGILRGAGFEGEVASPTFPIVLIYDDPELRLPVWHVDLYRIEDGTELEELALDEARADCLLLVEWPERMGALLWEDALRLRLSVAGEGVRALTAELPPAWKDRWPKQ